MPEGKDNAMVEEFRSHVKLCTITWLEEKFEFGADFWLDVENL